MLLTTEKSSFVRLLTNLLTMVFAVVIMTYALYKAQAVVIDAAFYWWNRVGWVMLGLLPLTAFFLYVVGQIVFLGQVRTERLRKDLDIVIFAAPLLGMLGTVDGLREALQQFYLIDGVENLMDVLGEFLKSASRMLYTTEWGLMIVIPAGLLKYIIFSETKSRESNPTENIYPLVTVINSTK